MIALLIAFFLPLKFYFFQKKKKPKKTPQKTKTTNQKGKYPQIIIKSSRRTFSESKIIVFLQKGLKWSPAQYHIVLMNAEETLPLQQFWAIL